MLGVVVLASCAAIAQLPNSIKSGPKPADIPKQWKPWIGEYGGAPSSPPTELVRVVSEHDGYIEILERTTTSSGVRYEKGEKFGIHESSPDARGFRTGQHGERELLLGDVVVGKITPDFGGQTQIVIKPVKSAAELRPDALAATPPKEAGTFRKPDLVELAPLDTSIHLDIRYATANDFLGTPVYSQARAFLQRPAAEALLRVQQKLKPLGYGLLIYDAYRPWYVTKIFWDATPPEGKIFVADPGQGSRHNRGCAVDLTLYDLATGKPIEMPGTYDEMSPRSFPDYPGGTSLQRWHRDLLRRAMESEGFTVYEAEWWHFDYKNWKEYPILNVPFEKLGLNAAAGATH
ncbi:MAG TPA: M15 family metallopeptidase [Candidatus Acidoferrum sp.]|nr:M15 family metallopeptidase [Candidatus Acidoferrum sp.]